MNIKETLAGYVQKEYYLPVTKDLLKGVKAAIKECSLTLLDEVELNDNVVVLKLHSEGGTYGIFLIGVILQTNIIFDKLIADAKIDAESLKSFIVSYKNGEA